MRSIKFRAWDSKKKIFVFVGFHIIGEVTAFGLLDQYRLEDFNNLVITQFTGKKDKNGVDLYEGDIIRGEEVHYDEKDDKMKSSGAVVGHVWYSEMSCEYIVSFNHLYSETSTEIKSIWKFEVIGNIFENENLLKENSIR